MCSMKDYASIRNACIENLRNDSGLIEGIKAMEGLGLSILMEKIVKGEDLLANISHLVDISWASLHTGPWREVPSIYREVYAYGSLLLSLLQAEVGNIKDAELTLDMCLMLGGGEETQRNKALIEVYKKLLFPPVPLLPSLPTTKSSFPPRKRRRLSTSLIHNNIERVDLPSITQFEELYFNIQKPVIISGVVSQWPAFQGENKWSNMEYIKKVAGSRTVPIEVGDTYMSLNWSQKLMRICDFIDTYIEGEEEGLKGYLAQFSLFEHIPELKKDILTPDYCICGDGENIITNAWFGPQGTVSPCHFDPYDNVLCQIVGSKYIRLYNPNQSENLYPHDGKMNNTSQVDVENPDLELFPKICKSSFFDCYLNEGEMLFIPKKWWHYVKSLERSFSKVRDRCLLNLFQVFMMKDNFKNLLSKK